MKTFAIVFVVCLVGAVIALDDAQKETPDQRINACLAETGMESEMWNGPRINEIGDGERKVSCFIACMMKKIGIMTADGVFDAEAIRRMVSTNFPAEKTDELVNKCKTITGSDECDTGRKVYNCYLKAGDMSIFA